MSIPSTKAQWRHHFKGLSLSRNQQIQGGNASADDLICQSLSGLLVGAKGPVAAYAPLASEPQIQSLIDGLNVDWVFPKVVGTHLEFYRSDFSDLVPGSFGCREPRAHESQYVPIAEVEWALVPGLGFDRSGVRLGRGKGFYDRSLQNFGGICVGVSYGTFVTNSLLPFEVHDLKMDFIVTENYILQTTGREKGR